MAYGHGFPVSALTAMTVRTAYHTCDNAVTKLICSFLHTAVIARRVLLTGSCYYKCISFHTLQIYKYSNECISFYT